MASNILRVVIVKKNFEESVGMLALTLGAKVKEQDGMTLAHYFQVRHFNKEQDAIG